MNTLDSYKVDLKNMRSDRSEYQYCLDKAFFEAINDVLIRDGNVSVNLLVQKVAGSYEFMFRMEGMVRIPCDRCLDEMELPVERVSCVKVKMGDEYADDGDMIVVPYEDGVLNVAHLMYEIIALEIPIKHVHAPGDCNVVMMRVLKEHEAADETGTVEENMSVGASRHGADDSGKSVDPRWDELKKILDNN